MGVRVRDALKTELIIISDRRDNPRHAKTDSHVEHFDKKINKQ
jgi:hypothetical protein